MVRGLFAAILFSFVLLIASFSFAAEMKYETEPTSLKVVITFEKGYSNVNTITLKRSVVVSLDSSENVSFNKELWDSHVKRFFAHSDGSRKKIIFEFSEKISNPEVITGDKQLAISFSFPKPAQQPAAVNSKVYARMFWGLLIILIIILVLYWFVKKYFKQKVFSDIPGTGRLLGKVDLDIRKSLFFYEIAEIIYIIGITDSGMQLLDKITDDEHINLIKAGFSKKKDFSSYLGFFNKGSEFKEDLETSKKSLSEKVEKLKDR